MGNKIELYFKYEKFETLSQGGMFFPRFAQSKFAPQSTISRVKKWRNK